MTTKLFCVLMKGVFSVLMKDVQKKKLFQCQKTHFINLNAAFSMYDITDLNFQQFKI